MASRTIGVGVIGTGVGARVHIPALMRTEGARVVALCSQDEARGATVARRWGIGQVVSGYRELAELPDVDLVCVTTRPDLHYPAVMAALEAGKPVLCEKPFAMDAGEAGRMLAAARAAGVRGFVNHEFRLSPTVVAMRRMIEEGFLGEVRQVVFTGANSFARSAQHRLGGWWFDETKGGGWLFAAGSHRIDSFRYLFGEITAVAAELQTVVKEPVTRDGPVISSVDDGFALLLSFAGGAAGICVSAASAVQPGRPDQLAAYGDAGTLLVEGERLFAGRGGSLEEVPLEPLAALDGEDQVQALVRLWMGEVVDAVRTGAPLRPDFEDGWRTQQVLDAARLAARERRWVEIG